MDLRPEPLRYVMLDALRGFAVMGILLMNITAFAMPEAGYFNPLAWGGDDPLNLWVWTVNFVLVDGKMRAMFSMLFGASALLVIERANACGQNGLTVHLRRMAALFAFGLLHYYFIWDGDILTLYAAIGTLVALVFAKSDRRKMRRSMFIFFGIAFLFWGLLAASFVMVDKGARQPGASQTAIAGATELRQDLGDPNSPGIEVQLNRMRGSYHAIAGQRLAKDTFEPLIAIPLFGFETAALMLLGMLLFRSGALTGKWPMRRYRNYGLICYAIGLSGTGLVAFAVWQSGFDTIITGVASFSLSLPFHGLTMLGHAAFAAILIKRFAQSPFVARVAATGRAAFTNYLGTSLVMTFIFYGYGLGWYGWISRWQTMVVVFIAWGLMLAWSKPWLDRFHYGPLEWLWRSLARWKWQKLRRMD